MSSGLLRIALECKKNKLGKDLKAGGLFAEPVWTMFCNGRKVGLAIKRQFVDADREVLGLMHSVTMGAGVIPAVAAAAAEEGSKGGGGVRDSSSDEEIMYMRARYERGSFSADNLSFHMINPNGSQGQELSIFFIRVGTMIRLFLKHQSLLLFSSSCIIVALEKNPCSFFGVFQWQIFHHVDREMGERDIDSGTTTTSVTHSSHKLPIQLCLDLVGQAHSLMSSIRSADHHDRVGATQTVQEMTDIWWDSYVIFRFGIRHLLPLPLLLAVATHPFS
ncbi:unnamed protein product [Sphagnum balticum]